jgi:hypothetical protein
MALGSAQEETRAPFFKTLDRFVRTAIVSEARISLNVSVEARAASVEVQLLPPDWIGPTVFSTLGTVSLQV